MNTDMEERGKLKVCTTAHEWAMHRNYPRKVYEPCLVLASRTSPSSQADALAVIKEALDTLASREEKEISTFIKVG